MCLTLSFNVNHSGIRLLAHTQNFACEPIHVWAKVLKSEQLKLQATVNNKKCLFCYSKKHLEILNFQKKAQISNIKYLNWMHNLEFEFKTVYKGIPDSV